MVSDIPAGDGKIATFFYSVRGPRSSLSYVLRNLSHHMIWQARPGDTELVKGREMTGRAQTLPLVAGGRRGKDDGKQDIGPIGHQYSHQHQYTILLYHLHNNHRAWMPLKELGGRVISQCLSRLFPTAIVAMSTIWKRSGTKLPSWHFLISKRNEPCLFQNFKKSKRSERCLFKL